VWGVEYSEAHRKELKMEWDSRRTEARDEINAYLRSRRSQLKKPLTYSPFRTL
jgi:hypothetical protein